MSSENPNMVYGRLSESVHISGYSLERALSEFEFLLTENRWQQVGNGFDDINDFLATISFKEFKIVADTRKSIATKLAALQASQRATARMIGVQPSTILRDIKSDIANATFSEDNTADYEDVINDTVANATPSETTKNDTAKSWLDISPSKVAEKLQKEEQKPHVSHNSGENEWYTPKYLIDAAKKVMGSIDLDPASCEIANQIVNATRYYTINDDGLSKEWFGNVWLNPPYSQPAISNFSDKVCKYEFNQACILVNNATETVWFQNMLKLSLCVCFLKGRVKFIDKSGEETGAPLQGQCVLYFGNNSDMFIKTFNNYGICMMTIKTIEVR